MTLADRDLELIGDALAFAARRRTRRHRRLTAARGALVACLLTACSVGIALAAGVDVPNILGFQQASLERATITTEATAPLPIPDSEKVILHNLGVAGDASAELLAIRGNLAFWRIERADDGYCFATGPAASARAGVFSEGATACGPKPGDPPFTTGRPITDMSTYHGTAVATFVAAFYGFAADQIAQVGVVDPQGDVYTVPVVDNVYYLAPPDAPSGPVTELVALNDAGAIVYRYPLPRLGVAPGNPVTPIILQGP
jgi:hypothetical protein